MLNYVMQLGRVAFVLQKRRKSMGEGGRRLPGGGEWQAEAHRERTRSGQGSAFAKTRKGYQA